MWKKPSWMNKIKCPYCGFKYIYVRPSDYQNLPHVYNWDCENCKERESWLDEHSLLLDYEDSE